MTTKKSKPKQCECCLTHCHSCERCFDNRGYNSSYSARGNKHVRLCPSCAE